MQYFWSYKWFSVEKEPQSIYYSAMQWATGLELYYVIADPKINE